MLQLSVDYVLRSPAQQIHKVLQKKYVKGWRRLRDLEALRSTVADKIVKIDASEAFELMWRFLALAESVYT